MDFLDEKRQEIGARIDELRPLVDEYRRLEAASVALAATNGVSTPTPAPTPARAMTGAPAGTRPRGRPKGSGTRGAEALALVRRQPGITIPQIAEHMGIKQNYLYRVLPGLETDGLVKRADDGRGWNPVAV